MNLSQILFKLNFKCKDKSVLLEEIKDIKIDHRKVNKGDVFIALKGVKHDGNDYIKQAFDNGATAVVTDKDIPQNQYSDRIVKVENARSAYSLMSKNFFGRACDRLRIIAVTGTNGKTTTCNTIASMLRGAGLKVGVIGTLGATVKDRAEDTGFTTPDPYKLHSLFSEMAANQDEYVVMEASAHALALNKLDGIHFEIGVLTNITEDHLDFFGDMETYAQAKLKLFDKNRLTIGIYCKDDPMVANYLNGREDLSLYSYGLDQTSDFAGQIIEKSFSGNHFTCQFKDEVYDIKSSLVGQFNVENQLASIAVCKMLGISYYNILQGLSKVKPVEGRFNVVRKQDSVVIVDFAHTPDGLKNLLTAIREITDKKIVVIFGCGGNRDKNKRPIMGRVAEQLADEVILTSDNPRDENPYKIISEIKSGINGKCKILPNRSRAIVYALDSFKDGYVIVIAGKGAEKYQEYGGEKHPYSDFEVVENYYNNKNNNFTNISETEFSAKENDCQNIKY